MATLVAVMTADVLPVTLGAVNTPLLEIDPVLADQVTPVFAVPLMLAVNCCWACEARVMLAGEIERMGPEGPEPPAETAMCAEVDPDSLPEYIEELSRGVAPFCFPGIVETESVKL